MDKKNLPMWELEESARERGFTLICGCDEAGAGPLAGPVYAGAVILPWGLELPYLNDSKQVTPKRRELLFDQIREQAVAWSVASVSPEEIDATDILSARMKAMQLAIDQLSPAPDYALVDGNRDKGKHFAISTPHETVVKGDGRSASIAAASILAKVSRDRYMEEMAEKYPQYRFSQHKGYGTKLHYQMLDQYGPSPIHRLTFLKKWEAARHE
ncbi:MAG: ribonuclease HII [Oscillibacter sp.]|nr:ribonuclease HII [Oscillibacter sp.]